MKQYRKSNVMTTSTQSVCCTPLWLKGSDAVQPAVSGRDRSKKCLGHGVGKRLGSRDGINFDVTLLR